jgi:thiamine-monophosphate kinase
MSPPGEPELVKHLRARAGRNSDVVLGIGDDAALLRVPPGQLLVVSTDTLVSGIHFPAHTAVADIGWKSIAVNLSDMAAMGAQPRWASLSLALPQLERSWIDAFLDGFLAAAQVYDVSLIGGDCTRAALPVISVTIHGLVPPEYALRRSGARVRDHLWLSGNTGAAAAGLMLVQSGADSSSAASQSALQRLQRPTPRVALGIALRDMATAALDISDGLLLDCQRMCGASGCAADIELSRLPISAALLELADGERCRAEEWALTGGDDYELLFAAVPEAESDLLALSQRMGLPLTRIGSFVAGDGQVQVLQDDGRQRQFARTGYDHTQ